MTEAPGRPGIPPRWTSSAKTGVGTARHGRVWFTTSHGILNEIYYPRIDRACTRDFGLLISAEDGLFLEEKRDATPQQHWLDHLAPGFAIRNDLPGDPIYTCGKRDIPHHRARCTAPGESRKRQRRMDLRLQGRSHALRSGFRNSHGNGDRRSMGGSFGWLRWNLRRVAGRPQAREDDLEIRQGRRRQRRSGG